MGGLAAVIDWERTVRPQQLDPMLALVPHRTAGGIGRIAFAHAALAESHFRNGASPAPSVTVLDHLSIVGDLRLWNRDGLRARAGGRLATTGMGDRRLLLEAYHRTGIDFLDGVDGDFAFVIWDDRERRVIAVRDRFGARPLFFEPSPTGVRLASEVKQLVATSLGPVEAHALSIAEHLTNRYEASRFSFFAGVERVPPSTAVVLEANSLRAIKYWEPQPDSIPAPDSADAAEGFREQLVESVKRRITGSGAAVAHVTGGHDSSSVTAAAHILADRDELTAPFHTVSAVFPGHANDESAWIADIAELQPFLHHNFVPQSETVERFEERMWWSDTPRPAIIDGIWTGTSAVARAIGADIVLTGQGGDEVLDQSGLLADALRTGNLAGWVKNARAYASWSGRRLDRVLANSLLRAIPPGFKPQIRSATRRTGLSTNALVRSETVDRAKAPRASRARSVAGFSWLTPNLIAGYVRAPRMVWNLEYDETMYARAGLEVTHPFLDRAVVEYVLGIPLAARPFDGRTKTLARQGFADRLPESIRDRRTVTLADTYLDTVVARLDPILRSRYPEVPPAARPFIDTQKYRAILHASAPQTPVYGDGSLWRAWLLMLWLDRIDRYEEPIEYGHTT